MPWWIKHAGRPYRWGWRVTVRQLVGEEPHRVCHEASQTATRTTSAPSVPTPLMLPQIWGTTCEHTLGRNRSRASTVPSALLKRGISSHTYALIQVKSPMLVNTVPIDLLGRETWMPTYWPIDLWMRQVPQLRLKTLDPREPMDSYSSHEREETFSYQFDIYIYNIYIFFSMRLFNMHFVFWPLLYILFWVWISLLQCNTVLFFGIFMLIT